MKTLYLDTPDFRRFATLTNRNYTWETELLPKIYQTQKRFIEPFVGAAQLDSLADAYLAASGLSDKQKKGLELLQIALGNYAELGLLTSERVNISSAGVTESYSSDRSTVPASTGAIFDAKEEAARKGDFFLSEALAYMEAEIAEFVVWEASSQYSSIKDHLICSLKQFQAHGMPMAGMRELMIVLPRVKDIQEVVLRAELGDTMLDGLIARHKDGTLTDDDKALVAQILPYLGRAALAKAIQRQKALVAANGVYFASHMGPKTAGSTEAERVGYMTALENEAEVYKVRLIRWLDAYQESYPDYTPTANSMSDYSPGYGPRKINRKGNKSVRM